MKTLLITGVLGFIGSNFIRKIIDKYPQYKFIGIDKAVKEYSLSNMFNHNRYNFYLGDIADSHFLDRVFKLEKPNIIINFAAESFVDAAEKDVLPFIHSNVLGIQTLLNASIKYKIDNFIHISTDEVYGSKNNINDTPWIETDQILPKNLYSSSKGCSELILLANHYTHKFNYNITRSANVFGPRQKKDNLIPMIITSLMNNKPITIHGKGNNFRQYVYVDDKISAIMKIVENGIKNEVYNIGDDNYFSNLDIVNYIAKLMDKKPEIQFIPDRLSHDFGYKVNSNKLRELGWKPKHIFEEAMKDTISWYVKNPHFYA